MFVNGQRVLRRARSLHGPVNAALRAVGVVGTTGRDEFDEIGLGRHRQTDGWLADATDP